MKIFQKSFFFSLIFKTSALLHINAVLFILFFLNETFSGPLIQRSQFLLSHQHWILISWISSIVAICSVVVTFSILTYSLDRSFHVLLNCAWFISLVAAMIAFLGHFVEMTIIPILFESIYTKSSLHLIVYLGKWEKLLEQLITQIVPICFAISGFFYTAVMFFTKKFPRPLSWWSFSIWTSLLIGVLFLKQIEMTFLYALFILFSYVPWLWKVGESFNQILAERQSGQLN